MATPPAAKALRESFGDRKPPDISRKITACVACRKLKIKCHINDGKPPCTRCKARGLSCAVNRSLQTLLESDASWKESIEQRLSQLERSLQLGASPSTRNLNHHKDSGARLNESSDHPSSTNPEGMRLNLSGSLGAFPASSIRDVATADQIKDTPIQLDLISNGMITLETGNAFFAFYKEHLDSSIHYVLDATSTLAGIRASSAMLTAAICAVASFSMGSKDYQSCVNALKLEVGRKFFSVHYTFDDVRALCIGAFWLSDLSSSLNGMAVRIGTQLNLHRCISKMPHTKKDCYDRTRLYFLTFLCDHHCSLVYGRPTMTTEFRSLKGPESFLRSEFSTKADLYLISQVEFWSLNRRIFNLFGSDIESTIVDQRFLELERLNASFNRWYEDWRDILGLSRSENRTSRRMFDFYFHSAKLYLFSHVFRGPPETESPTSTSNANTSNADMAQLAADSALSILKCAVDGDDHLWLEKLPSYFGTMIAFASVCLIRTTLQDAPTGDAKATETLRYLHKVPEILRASAIADSATHPLTSIARSLEAAINERHAPPVADTTDDGMLDLTFDWDLFTSDPLNLSFPGDEDNWMLCPEQMPDMVF